MSQFRKLSIVALLILTSSVIYNLAEAYSNWEEVFWEDVKDLEHNTTVLLVDVREPSELAETGIIPGAINIPLNSLETKLTLSAEEFFKEFHRDKPQSDSIIVFYCRAGNRSTQASNIAISLGFTNIKNYRGGWLDWAKHLPQNK